MRSLDLEQQCAFVSVVGGSALDRNDEASRRNQIRGREIARSRAMGKHLAIAGDHTLIQRLTFLVCADSSGSSLEFRVDFLAGPTQAAL